MTNERQLNWGVSEGNGRGRHRWRNENSGLLWQTTSLANSNYQQVFCVLYNFPFWGSWKSETSLLTPAQREVDSAMLCKFIEGLASRHVGVLSKSLLSRGRPRAESTVCIEKIVSRISLL